MTVPRCRLRPAALLLGVLCLAAAPGPRLAAQVVTGDVVEEGSGRPLAGTYVVLENAVGASLDAVLADDAGRFTLSAPAGGPYTLVARLIGYGDTRSDRFQLAPGETLRMTLPVSVQAISLAGISVDVGKQCVGRPSGGDDVSTLWTEARKALEIVEWADSEGVLRHHVVEERRVLEASTLRATAVRRQLRRGIYQGSPYVSRPAADLAAAGYIQPAPDAPGEWDYYAPDGAVLLSDSFLDTHCFGISPESDEQRVGLRFEPVVGRDVPDIEGVLWLDRTTAELRELEFTYVDLPFDLEDTENVGGRVVFERLANGAWIVRRWNLRMPLDVERSGGFGGSRGQTVVRTLSEQGASVERVETLDGTTLVAATEPPWLGTRGDSTATAGSADVTPPAAPPVALEGVEVNVERRSDFLDRQGFYDRQLMGTGEFVDVEAMDIARFSRTTNLLDRVPGVSLHAGREPIFVTAQKPDLTGRRVGPCHPMVLVDGHPVRVDQEVDPERGNTFDNIAPPPGQIAAIEVYRTTAMAPAQWKSMENDCGVIVIWTKR